MKKYYKSNCQNKSIYRMLDLSDDGKFKFYEKIIIVDKKCWEPKEINEEEFNKQKPQKLNSIICLGYNPALADKKIDKTNQLLIKVLINKKYNYYTLLNLYPQITSSAYEVRKDLKENLKWCSNLKKLLKKTQGEIVIFFGSSAIISKEHKKILKKNLKRIKYYSTDATGYFKHPASHISPLNFKFELFNKKDFHFSKNFNNIKL